MPSTGRRFPCLLAVLLLAASVVGCAQQSVPVVARAEPPQSTGPSTWTLEQIRPSPVLPAAATRPAETAAPLEAIELFARARVASQDGDRRTAILLLQQALAVDPDSAELNYELGNLHRQGLGHSLEALKYFERAAEIEPDRLDVQVDIARQLLAANDTASALGRLRLAIQTTAYAAGDMRSAEADFLLAHALSELGYHRAALDRYELLIDRLARGDVDRSDALAGILSTRLYMQVGDLYLRQNRLADALAAYRTAEGTLHGSRDIEIQSRIVRTLMLSGQVQQGIARAADVVRQFGASPASLSLLRDVYAATGRPDGVTAALSDLHRQAPDDRAILFALCEVLAADGRFDNADSLLTAAWQRAPHAALLVRWFRLRFERDPAAAVALLDELLTEHPALAGQIDPVWRRLLAPEGRRRLPIDHLAAMAPPSGCAAAHGYVVWRVARDWPRTTLARRSLESALAARPVFAPAFIARMDEVLNNERLARRSRLAAAIELANAAETGGAPGLADLLRGRIALFSDEPAEARSSFSAAAARHPDWPEPRLGVARSLLAIGQEIAAVETAWEIANQHPGFEPAFMLLNDLPDRADPARLFTAWHDAQPTGEPKSPELAVQQAEDQLVRGRPDGAELLLADLEREFPADAGLLDITRRIAIAQPGPSPETSHAVADAKMTARLEQLLAQGQRIGPAALTDVAVRLARFYSAGGRGEEAVRVLDFARATVGMAEPDLLFKLASGYRDAGESATAERLMTGVLEIDPQHTGAAFELSSLWAEQGRQLAAAERLARELAERFPSDPLYRGNVGWTLYRTGQLQAAKSELLSAVSLSEDLEPQLPTSAAGPDGRPAKADRADPVLLDRAGDALYRLGDRQTAAAFWERAQRRLGDIDVATLDRADITALRQSLPRKLRQHRTGQDVQVSAVARGPGE